MSGPEDFNNNVENQFPSAEWLEFGLADRFAGIDSSSELGSLVLGLTKEYYGNLKPWLIENGYELKGDGRIIDYSVTGGELIEENYTLLKKNKLENMHHAISSNISMGMDYEDAVLKTTGNFLDKVKEVDALNPLSESAKDTLSDLIFTARNLYRKESDLHYKGVLANSR